MSFIVPKKVINEINSLFQKKDYNKSEVKVQISDDFIVIVDGKKIRFFARENKSLVYLIADYEFPEKDMEEYLEYFRDGILPFASLEALNKTSRLLGNSEYVYFDYEEKSSKINIETFGSLKKFIEYQTLPLEDNSSYIKYDKFIEVYNLIDDIPYGHDRDEDGNITDRYKFEHKLQFSGSQLNEIIRDSAIHDTRRFVINFVSEDLAYLYAYNNEENGKNSIKYNLETTATNYVNVGEKEFGFGFSQIAAKFSGLVELFYSEDPEIFSCVFRNNSGDIQYNVLINFDESEDQTVTTTSSDLDEEEYDLDDKVDKDDEDDIGDLEE